MQRALRGHKVKTVAPKAATVPIEPSNYLEHRGERRKEFDAKTKEANELAELERQKRNADPHLSIGLGGVHLGIGSPYHGYRAPAPYYYPNYYHHHHHGYVY